MAPEQALLIIGLWKGDPPFIPLPILTLYTVALLTQMSLECFYPLIILLIHLTDISENFQYTGIKRWIKPIPDFKQVRI